MAMSEPLSGLSLSSPPPPPQLATSTSSSTDDGVDMSAGDEEDIIKNFGATSRYAGKLSSFVSNSQRLPKARRFSWKIL